MMCVWCMDLLDLITYYTVADPTWGSAKQTITQRKVNWQMTTNNSFSGLHYLLFHHTRNNILTLSFRIFLQPWLWITVCSHCPLFRLSVYLSVHLPHCIPVCLPVHLSIYLFVSLTVLFPSSSTKALYDVSTYIVNALFHSGSTVL